MEMFYSLTGRCVKQVRSPALQFCSDFIWLKQKACQGFIPTCQWTLERYRAWAQSWSSAALAARSVLPSNRPATPLFSPACWEPGFQAWAQALLQAVLATVEITNAGEQNIQVYLAGRMVKDLKVVSSTIRPRRPPTSSSRYCPAEPASPLALCPRGSRSSDVTLSHPSPTP